MDKLGMTRMLPVHGNSICSHSVAALLAVYHTLLDRDIPEFSERCRHMRLHSVNESEMVRIDCVDSDKGAGGAVTQPQVASEHSHT